jgi:hypothetical protein
MKCGGDWLAKGGKQPGKDGITERTQPIFLNRLTTMLGIGSLVFIGVTSAALGILWDGPKEAMRYRLNASELSVEITRHTVAVVESKPPILDPPARITSSYPSSIPPRKFYLRMVQRGQSGTKLGSKVDQVLS